MPTSASGYSYRAAMMTESMPGGPIVRLNHLTSWDILINAMTYQTIRSVKLNIENLKNRSSINFHLK